MSLPPCVPLLSVFISSWTRHAFWPFWSLLFDGWCDCRSSLPRVAMFLIKQRDGILLLPLLSETSCNSQTKWNLNALLANLIWCMQDSPLIKIEAVWGEGLKCINPKVFPLFSLSEVGHYLFNYHHCKILKGVVNCIKMFSNRFIRELLIVIRPMALHL